MKQDAKNCMVYMLKAWGQLPTVFACTFRTLWVLLCEAADSVKLLFVCLCSVLLIVLMPFFFWLAPVIVYFSNRKNPVKQPSTDVWDYQNKPEDKEVSNV